MADMLRHWQIDELSSDDSIIESIKIGMEKVADRENLVKRMKRSTRFVRSTQNTDKIAHNYMIEQVIEDSLKKGRKSREKRAGEDMETVRKRCMNFTDTDRDSECAVCNASSPYRTFSGCCNNLAKKEFGEANQPFKRLLSTKYFNSLSLPKGGLTSSSLPSPRRVSSLIHRPIGKETRSSTTVMLMQFAQFLDHDITLTPEQGRFFNI